MHEKKKKKVVPYMIFFFFLIFTGVLCSNAVKKPKYHLEKKKKNFFIYNLQYSQISLISDYNPNIIFGKISRADGVKISLQKIRICVFLNHSYSTCLLCCCIFHLLVSKHSGSNAYSLSIEGSKKKKTTSIKKKNCFISFSFFIK